MGASADNAEILVIVSATRLQRSQLVGQVKTIGPTFGSPLLWITSMVFCEIPIILFTELHVVKVDGGNVNEINVARIVIELLTISMAILSPAE